MRYGFLDPGLWPSWITDGIGGAMLLSIGRHCDALLEAQFEGTRRRFPSMADDELEEIGRDRGIPRLPTESIISYRRRLIEWIATKKSAGSDDSSLKELAAYWAPETPVMRIVSGNQDRAMWTTLDSTGTFSTVRREPTNWDWESNYPYLSPSPKIYRYWVIIYAPPSVTPHSSFVLPSPTISAGSSLTVQQAADLSTIDGRNKAAGSRCGGIILSFDPLLFDPFGGPGIDYPDGYWYRHTRPNYTLTRPNAIRVYAEEPRRGV
ncbi:MAG: hypothetical protein IPH12_18715 [Saprospirales bacterium]|nr:hypothetical protein [Saprospirales bacterium]